MGGPVYFSHPSSLHHDTGQHPETAARITAIEHAMEAQDWLGYERVSSVAAAEELVTAVHDVALVDLIRAASAAGGRRLDADTIVSAGSWTAALHAAGGACQLVDRLLSGDAPTGMSAHRPPGHHAERSTAMGFCLFNSVAVAAAHARQAHGCERVLILDWDVHHGNGTNDIFHASADVCYVSIHQSPLYPGTGAATDVGVDAGAGFTVNLPVPAGSGDGRFVSLVEHVVVPIAQAYVPGLILISAGFDAHVDDPLADCRVSTEGYMRMAAAVRGVGASLQVPIGVVLEGGYDLAALAASTVATLAVLAGRLEGPAASSDLDPIAEAARMRLAGYWPLG